MHSLRSLDPRIPCLATLALTLSLALPGAATAAGPALGPGSAAWVDDLAALEAAADRDAPELEARIQAFFETHRVLESIFRLRRAVGFYPRTGSGRSDPPDPTNARPRYRLAPLAQSPFHLVDYQEKLDELLPEVDAGRRTLEWARKRAARYQRMTGWLRSQSGVEIADLRESTGVWVHVPLGWREDWGDEFLEILSPSTRDPDRYKTFDYSWTDLHTRIAFDHDLRIVAIDREERAAGLRSLVTLLRNLGELAPVFPAGS